MMSFEEHTHDDLLIQTEYQKAIDLKPSKPFRVAYISLRSNEKYQPVRDELTCLVRVYMVDDFRPKLGFQIVEKKEHDENDENSVGGFSDSSIYEILNDIEDGILYNELKWVSRSTSISNFYQN